ncbi:methyltransferase domain-containing protein [archaeon]|nr:methyltransferase domain-containing protein [archaeon]MBT7128940.1 methyltransferase domain-containing protein [archaeon]
MEETKVVENCRSCGRHGLIPIMSLGEHYVSGFVDSEDVQSIKVPLELVLCSEEDSGCGLLQLKHSAPDSSMWGEKYWYKSGINEMIKDDLKDIVDSSEKLINLQSGDVVVDIGCNDGTLLRYYDKEGTCLVGFDPSTNVAKEAIVGTDKIINDYFNAKKFREEFGDKKAKIITAISMFYDLEDPNKFLEDIKEVLDKDGLFIIQQNYLVGMLEQNAFDNICHEHREYYCFRSLKKLLDRHDLEIFDIKLNNINGGSIRTYIKIKGNSKITPFRGAHDRITNIKEKELQLGLNTLKPYANFASRIENIKNELLEFLRQEKAKGKVIGISGASTRGNTTLQYFGLGPDLITAIEERNPDKFGKKTMGSFIPIVSEKEMEAINPDYLLVLIWYFFDVIKGRKESFLENGGKFILHLPEFRIVAKD